jgi:hypothetical protein
MLAEKSGQAAEAERPKECRYIQMYFCIETGLHMLVRSCVEEERINLRTIFVHSGDRHARDSVRAPLCSFSDDVLKVVHERRLDLVLNYSMMKDARVRLIAGLVI